jgi:hypothetical protein
MAAPVGLSVRLMDGAALILPLCSPHASRKAVGKRLRRPNLRVWISAFPVASALLALHDPFS